MNSAGTTENCSSDHCYKGRRAFFFWSLTNPRASDAGSGFKRLAGPIRQVAGRVDMGWTEKEALLLVGPTTVTAIGLEF